MWQPPVPDSHQGQNIIKITVDTSRCIGAGQCVWVAPRVFDQGENDGLARLLLTEPPAELHEFVREAARVCPARAIHIIEEI
ncbi:MAG: ferredoxin [Betaproteobacteria bacterium]